LAAQRRDPQSVAAALPKIVAATDEFRAAAASKYS
jgi:hypothetical protein